jgi:putative hydrolase of the HAD superfamily
MKPFDVIAFDADDTLWQNERLYTAVQERFKQLLARYHSPEWVEQRLYQTEMRNLQHYGYGIKSFTLSMIETAVELTEGRVTAQDVAAIIGFAKWMLAAPCELLPEAGETVARLAQDYPLMIVTKGDLRDQETKLARSGLAPYFRHIEIVVDKTEARYAALLAEHGLAPQRFLMVGNSLRSDILPVLALGGWAVYVPYHLTWAHEACEPPPAGQPRFFEIEHLGRLPELLAGLPTL